MHEMLYIRMRMRMLSQNYVLIIIPLHMSAICSTPAFHLELIGNLLGSGITWSLLHPPIKLTLILLFVVELEQ